MKKQLLVIILFMFFLKPSHAQQNESKLRLKKSRIEFIDDGQARMIKPKEALNILKDDPAAYAEFKKAKSNYDVATVFGTVGGFMIGLPLGTALGGGDPQWGLAGAGVGVALLAIPLNSSFKKHAQNAFNIYNGSPSAQSNSLKINFMPYGAGAKLIVKF